MVQVIIIGGGFAGMALSLFLKKQNITSAIYELRDENYTSGGNIALAPNALRVLDSVGVFERIRTQGYNYDEIHFSNAHGVTLGAFLNGSRQKYGFHALRIHRSIVQKEMRAEVARQDIPIFFHKTCTAITQDSSETVTVSFADGTTATGEFVIGADGMHSRVRQHISTSPPTFGGLSGIMGYVNASELASVLPDDNIPLPAMLFGQNGSFAIMPASYSGDEIGYFASIELPDRSREEWTNLASSPQDLRAILDDRFRGPAHWPALVQTLVEKTPDDSLSVWPFFSAPDLAHYFSPSARVILIGDAAHAIPPTGGQGAAMALEDAATLGYALALLLAPADVPADAGAQERRVQGIVGRWEKHRRLRIQRVMDFTSKNGNLRKSAAHYIEQAAKEWIMWIAFKWMGEEGGARWMYDYRAEEVRGDL